MSISLNCQWTNQVLMLLSIYLFIYYVFRLTYFSVIQYLKVLYCCVHYYKPNFSLTLFTLSVSCPTNCCSCKKKKKTCSPAVWLSEVSVNGGSLGQLQRNEWSWSLWEFPQWFGLFREKSQRLRFMTKVLKLCKHYQWDKLFLVLY